jgi:hypothetical protein
MVIFHPMYPIYGGVIVHTVQYFHRFPSDLRHIYANGDAREDSPYALKTINIAPCRLLGEHLVNPNLKKSELVVGKGLTTIERRIK